MKTENSRSAGATKTTPVRKGILAWLFTDLVFILYFLFSYKLGAYEPGVNQVATPSCRYCATSAADFSPRNMPWIPSPISVEPVGSP